MSTTGPAASPLSTLPHLSPYSPSPPLRCFSGLKPTLRAIQFGGCAPDLTLYLLRLVLHPLDSLLISFPLLLRTANNLPSTPHIQTHSQHSDASAWQNIYHRPIQFYSHYSPYILICQSTLVNCTYISLHINSAFSVLFCSIYH